MMRLSVWQQFSSNHSARFTVVGQFISPEAAQKAADELTRMMATIQKWYADPQHPERLEAAETGSLMPPSDPEIEFSKQYGVDWGEYGIDWFWLDESERAITNVDKLVFVNGPESDLGPKPADQLIARLGGQALIDGTREGYEGPFSTVKIDVSCVAPNLATAERIAKEFRDYQILRQDSREAGDTFKTPWQGYCQRFEVSSVLSGGVRCDGLRVYFEELSIWHLGYGLPGLLNYLKDNGCVDIEYNLTEIRDEEDDEG